MREAPGGESGEEQLGPGRREVISEERAISLIRERPQSDGGRAGALYWAQSLSNERRRREMDTIS